MEKMIILLVCAHIFADFTFQGNSLAGNKHKPVFLLLHAFIHAILTYLILQKWGYWQAPLFVLIMHGVIDFIKERLGKNTAKDFVVDQCMHILSLVGIGWLFNHLWGYSFSGSGYKLIVFIAGLIATVQVAGIIIGKITAKLMKESNLEPKGLKNGGKIIGQLERTLIFMLVFIGQPAGIGFLVAAKSILRFQESKDHQEMTEYILIGTLLSFSLAIAMASISKWAINY